MVNQRRGRRQGRSRRGRGGDGGNNGGRNTGGRQQTNGNGSSTNTGTVNGLIKDGAYGKQLLAQSKRNGNQVARTYFNAVHRILITPKHPSEDLSSSVLLKSGIILCASKLKLGMESPNGKIGVPATFNVKQSDEIYNEDKTENKYLIIVRNKKTGEYIIDMHKARWLAGSDSVLKKIIGSLETLLDNEVQSDGLRPILKKIREDNGAYPVQKTVEDHATVSTSTVDVDEKDSSTKVYTEDEIVMEAVANLTIHKGLTRRVKRLVATTLMEGNASIQALIGDIIAHCYKQIIAPLYIAYFKDGLPRGRSLEKFVEWDYGNSVATISYMFGWLTAVKEKIRRVLTFLNGGNPVLARSHVVKIKQKYVNNFQYEDFVKDPCLWLQINLYIRYYLQEFQMDVSGVMTESSMTLANFHERMLDKARKGLLKVTGYRTREDNQTISKALNDLVLKVEEQLRLTDRGRIKISAAESVQEMTLEEYCENNVFTEAAESHRLKDKSHLAMVSLMKYVVLLEDHRALGTPSAGTNDPIGDRELLEMEEKSGSSTGAGIFGVRSNGERKSGTETKSNNRPDSALTADDLVRNYCHPRIFCGTDSKYGCNDENCRFKHTKDKIQKYEMLKEVYDKVPSDKKKKKKNMEHNFANRKKMDNCNQPYTLDTFPSSRNSRRNRNSQSSTTDNRDEVAASTATSTATTTTTTTSSSNDGGGRVHRRNNRPSSQSSSTNTIVGRVSQENVISSNTRRRLSNFRHRRRCAHRRRCFTVVEDRNPTHGAEMDYFRDTHRMMSGEDGDFETLLATVQALKEQSSINKDSKISDGKTYSLLAEAVDVGEFVNAMGEHERVFSNRDVARQDLRNDDVGVNISPGLQVGSIGLYDSKRKLPKKYCRNLQALDGDLIPLTDSKTAISVHQPLVNIMHVGLTDNERQQHLVEQQNSWMQFLSEKDAVTVYDTGAEATVISVACQEDYEQVKLLLDECSEYTFYYKVFGHRGSTRSCWGLMAGIPITVSIDPTSKHPYLLVSGRCFEVQYDEPGKMKAEDQSVHSFVFEEQFFRYSSGGDKMLELEIDGLFKFQRAFHQSRGFAVTDAFLDICREDQQERKHAQQYFVRRAVMKTFFTTTETIASSDMVDTSNSIHSKGGVRREFSILEDQAKDASTSVENPPVTGQYLVQDIYYRLIFVLVIVFLAIGTLLTGILDSSFNSDPISPWTELPSKEQQSASLAALTEGRSDDEKAVHTLYDADHDWVVGWVGGFKRIWSIRIEHSQVAPRLARRIDYRMNSYTLANAIEKGTVQFDKVTGRGLRRSAKKNKAGMVMEHFGRSWRAPLEKVSRFQIPTGPDNFVMLTYCIRMDIAYHNPKGVNGEIGTLLMVSKKFPRFKFAHPMMGKEIADYIEGLMHLYRHFRQLGVLGANDTLHIEILGVDAEITLGSEVLKKHFEQNKKVAIGRVITAATDAQWANGIAESGVREYDNAMLTAISRAGGKREIATAYYYIPFNAASLCLPDEEQEYLTIWQLLNLVGDFSVEDLVVPFSPCLHRIPSRKRDMKSSLRNIPAMILGAIPGEKGCVWILSKGIKDVNKKKIHMSDLKVDEFRGWHMYSQSFVSLIQDPLSDPLFHERKGQYLPAYHSVARKVEDDVELREEEYNEDDEEETDFIPAEEVDDELLELDDNGDQKLAFTPDDYSEKRRFVHATDGLTSRQRAMRAAELERKLEESRRTYDQYIDLLVCVKVEGSMYVGKIIEIDDDDMMLAFYPKQGELDWSSIWYDKAQVQRRRTLFNTCYNAGIFDRDFLDEVTLLEREDLQKLIDEDRLADYGEDGPPPPGFEEAEDEDPVQNDRARIQVELRPIDDEEVIIDDAVEETVAEDDMFDRVNEYPTPCVDSPPGKHNSNKAEGHRYNTRYRKALGERASKKVDQDDEKMSGKVSSRDTRRSEETEESREAETENDVLHVRLCGVEMEISKDTVEDMKTEDLFMSERDKRRLGTKWTQVSDFFHAIGECFEQTDDGNVFDINKLEQMHAPKRNKETDPNYEPRGDWDVKGCLREDEIWTARANEIKGLERRKCYKPRLLSEARKIKGAVIRRCRMIYTVKRTGKIKARYVWDGRRDVEDWFGAIMHIVRQENLRLVILIASLHGLKLSTADIEQAYITTKIAEDSEDYEKYFFRFEKGFTFEGKEYDNEVWCMQLLSYQYGMKRAGNRYSHSQANLLTDGDDWKRSFTELALYTKIDSEAEYFSILTTIVDDLLLADEEKMWDEIQAKLAKGGYDIKICRDVDIDYGGNMILSRDDGNYFHRNNFILKACKAVEMVLDCELKVTRRHFLPLPEKGTMKNAYQELLPEVNKTMTLKLQFLAGILNWVLGGGTLTIAFATHMIQRCMHRGSQFHLDMGIHIMTHLKWFVRYGPANFYPTAKYMLDNKIELRATVQSDASFADHEDGGSTIARLTRIGSGVVAYGVQKATGVKISTSGAEIQGGSRGQHDMVAAAIVCNDLCHSCEAFDLENDNLQALKKLKIDNKSSRMRHVKQHHFWSRRLGELGMRRSEIHVGTDVLIADKMTKNYRNVKKFYRAMLQVMVLLNDPDQQHFWKEIESGKISALPNTERTARAVGQVDSKEE